MWPKYYVSVHFKLSHETQLEILIVIIPLELTFPKPKLCINLQNTQGFLLFFHDTKYICEVKGGEQSWKCADGWFFC